MSDELDIDNKKEDKIKLLVPHVKIGSFLQRREAQCVASVFTDQKYFLCDGTLTLALDPCFEGKLKNILGSDWENDLKYLSECLKKLRVIKGFYDALTPDAIKRSEQNDKKFNLFIKAITSLDSMMDLKLTRIYVKLITSTTLGNDTITRNLLSEERREVKRYETKDEIKYEQEQEKKKRLESGIYEKEEVNKNAS